jgi:hypothetical protein
MIHAIYPSLHPSLPPSLPPSTSGFTALCWPLVTFQFLNPIHSRYDPLNGGSASHKAATYTQNNTKANKGPQISMPPLGSEATIPVFEQAKTVHALDRAATVIG